MLRPLGARHCLPTRSIHFIARCGLRGPRRLRVAGSDPWQVALDCRRGAVMHDPGDHSPAPPNFARPHESPASAGASAEPGC